MKTWEYLKIKNEENEENAANKAWSPTARKPTLKSQRCGRLRPCDRYAQ